MTKTCLVTGCAGFIGSALTKRLWKDGWCVDLVDDLSTGKMQNLPTKLHDRLWIKSCGCPEIQDHIRQRKYDLVFHQAALARVSYSIDHPVDATAANIMETVKLLDACKGNVGKVVLASSSSVYGDVNEAQLPLHEEMSKNPASPYALQKAFIEDYATMARELYGMEITCLRYFNVFGPGQRCGSAYSTVIPAWLSALTLKMSSMIKLNLDGDGTQTRDFAYIDDVVNANLCAVSAKSGIYNVAGGNRISLNKILSYLEEKYKFEVVARPPRKGDIKHTEAYMDLAESELGYKPTDTFYNGLMRTCDWWGLNG